MPSVISTEDIRLFIGTRDQCGRGYDGILFSIRFLKLTLRGTCFFRYGKVCFYGWVFLIAIIFSSGLAKMAARMLFTISKGMKGKTPLVMTAAQGISVTKWS